MGKFQIISKIEYKVGDRIILVSTTEENTNLKPGDRGVVNYIDSIGTIHIKWDNGSCLGMIPGLDEIRLDLQREDKLNRILK